MSGALTLSIIIPVYNRADMMASLMDHLSKQIAGTATEIIIVDDGSSDNLQDAVRRFDKAKVKYFYQENSGVCNARNLGLEMAQGKYIIFLDSDDNVEGNYIKRFLSEVNEHVPDIVFCGAKIIKPKKQNDVLLDPEVPYGRNSKGKGLFLAGTFCVKKSVVTKTGGYDPKIKYGENSELALRIRPELKNVRIIKEPLLIVNQEKDERTSLNLHNHVLSLLYIIKKHRNFYNKNKENKAAFLRSGAVTLIKNNKPLLAKKLLGSSLKAYPFDFHSWLRLFVLKVPFLRRRIWSLNGH